MNSSAENASVGLGVFKRLNDSNASLDFCKNPIVVKKSEEASRYLSFDESEQDSQPENSAITSDLVNVKQNSQTKKGNKYTQNRSFFPSATTKVYSSGKSVKFIRNSTGSQQETPLKSGKDTAVSPIQVLPKTLFLIPPCEENMNFKKLLPKNNSTPITHEQCEGMNRCSQLRTRLSARRLLNQPRFIESPVGLTSSMNEDIQKILDIEKKQFGIESNSVEACQKAKRTKLRKSTIRKLQKTITDTIRAEITKAFPKQRLAPNQRFRRPLKTTVVQHQIVRKVEKKRRPTVEKKIQVNVCSTVDCGVQTEPENQSVNTGQHLSAILEDPSDEVQVVKITKGQRTAFGVRRSIRIRSLSQND